jgi:hypothetical protein
MVSALKAAATASDATNAARITSAAIRIWRLLLRSTKPPVTIARITPGASCIAARMPTTASGSPSVDTAMIGSAVRVIRDPKALIACAAQSLRKSAWRHKPRSLGSWVGGGEGVMAVLGGQRSEHAVGTGIWQRRSGQAFGGSGQACIGSGQAGVGSSDRQDSSLRPQPGSNTIGASTFAGPPGNRARLITPITHLSNVATAEGWYGRAEMTLPVLSTPIW